jgi:hypothetical protein
MLSKGIPSHYLGYSVSFDSREVWTILWRRIRIARPWFRRQSPTTRVMKKIAENSSSALKACLTTCGLTQERNPTCALSSTAQNASSKCRTFRSTLTRTERMALLSNVGNALGNIRKSLLLNTHVNVQPQSHRKLRGHQHPSKSKKNKKTKTLVVLIPSTCLSDDLTTLIISYE